MDLSHQSGGGKTRDFLLLAEAMPAGLLVHEAPEGRVSYCNAQAATLLGVAPGDLIGSTGILPGWRLVRADTTDLPPHMHPVSQAFESGLPVGPVMVGLVSGEPGAPAWLNVSAQPVAGEDGNVGSVLAILSDASGQAYSPAADPELRTLNEQVLDNLPVQLAIYDTAGRYVYVNSAAVEGPAERHRIFGQTDSEYFSGRGGDWELIARRRAEAVARCLRERRTVTLQEEDPPTEFERRSYLRFFAPAAGAVERVISYGLDITDRRQAEDERWLAETRYRKLVERLPLVTYVAAVDRRRTTSYINPQIESFLGYAPAEWIRNPDLWTHCIHPDDRLRVIEEVLSMTSTGKHFQCEYRMISRDGRVLWVVDEAIVVRDEAGRARTVQGFILDITERRKSQETIAHLASIVESTGDAIFSLNAFGAVVTANPAAETVYGYPVDELVGRTFSDFSSPDHADMEDEALLRLLRGEKRLQYESVHVRGDGRTFDVSVTLSPLLGANEGRIGTAVVARDITERRSLETQLRQAQKMEAIGQLAGGVAHDFNNLLTAITGYTELLLAEVDPGSLMRADLEEISRAAERAAWLTRQLLAFSRRQVMAPEVLDLNKVVANMEKLLRRLIGEDIRLETSLAKDLGVVRADPIQIEQVLMNLAVNARDAMPDGGWLRIGTENGHMDAELAARYSSIQAGPCVILTFSDTGIGMDAETQARAFEPFFTTKARGRGTGLGLSTAYGIVKQSGGSIWVRSEVGKGATFQVYLPRLDADRASQPPPGIAVSPPPASHRMETPLPAGAAPVPAERAAPVAGKPAGTVLLVEDEEAVRALALQVLTRGGFRVLAARNGNEALLALQGHEGPLDLLLTDVIMPGMNGKEVARRILAQSPLTRVVYMSGHSDTDLSRTGVLGRTALFLYKPFRPEDLLSKVRQALAANAD